jgi:hypothetical protein
VNELWSLRRAEEGNHHILQNIILAGHLARDLIPVSIVKSMLRYLTVPPGTLEVAAEFYEGTLGLARVVVPHLKKDTLAW